MSTCFNPSCGESSNLIQLLMKVKGITDYQALRVILKFKHEAPPVAERLKKVMTDVPEFTLFPQEVLDKTKADFPGSPGEEYMRSRGFEDQTLDYFDVGYSVKKNMVVVPMHDPKGNPIGLIGRTASHEEKRFKNSVNLPKSKTMWNFHRAKTYGESVIICEASYDAMRIYQAGFPNVVALLGGHITDHHVNQLNRHFSTITIMTDYDPLQYRANCKLCRHLTFGRDEARCVGHRPGRELGNSIANKLPHKRILWAAYNETCVFPHGAKDASDMTDEEIRQCIGRAVPNITYQSTLAS